MRHYYNILNKYTEGKYMYKIVTLKMLVMKMIVKRLFYSLLLITLSNY